jgi:phosphoenolpyruvate carboxykinase (GTP)
VTESYDWQQGVFLAANTASEGTAAAENKVGELRRDPFAMLPFCGYNMADYFGHWLKIGQKAGGKLPRIYFVNWFRKDLHGKFVWPGYGENSRVLKWIVGRLEGTAGAHDTPIGRLPNQDSLDVDGLNLAEDQVHLLLSVARSVWKEEAALIPGFYERFGDRMPQALWDEHEALIQRLEAWPHESYAGA